MIVTEERLVKDFDGRCDRVAGNCDGKRTCRSRETIYDGRIRDCDGKVGHNL